MAGKPKRDVTEAELAVLRELWSRGASTIRDVTDRLYPGGGASAYGTVQKLLERLEAKACVTRDRAPMPHVFCAAIDRQALISQRLGALADDLCDGALAPLLTNLVSHRRLSDAERQALRALVDELDGKRRKRS